jgi:hypothetical protein
MHHRALTLAALAVLALARAGLAGVPSVDRFPVATFRAHVAWLADDARDGRRAGSGGGRDAGEYIARHLAAAGLKPAAPDGSFFQPFTLADGRAARNVLASVPGRGALAAECVVLAAHYDHIGTTPETTAGARPDDRVCNGADDNASGVAALLLIAADTARGAGAADGPSRTVLFIAFDAEEGGLNGSKYYVDHPAVPLDRTRAVLNFDMIGHLNRGTLYAGDAPSSPAFGPILEAVARASGVAIETRFGGVARSDHAPFLDKGVPGIHFNTGLYPEYHGPADELPIVDCDGGATATRIGAAVLEVLARGDGPVPFARLDPSYNVEHAIRLVTLLGAVPNVRAQAGRYPRVLFVAPGSPAARCGVRAGDELAAVDGREIARVEDAVALVPALRLDRGVRVRLMRRGEPVEIFMPPDLFASLLGPRVQEQPDGRYRVRFELTPPAGTKSVHVVGSFNDWATARLPMTGPDDHGRFVAEVTLPKGTYEYQFALDGGTRQPDPRNVHQVGTGRRHSVVWAGTREPDNDHDPAARRATP